MDNKSMNKKITLVILSLLLPLTFLLFYTLDRNDSKSEKRVIDEPSTGSGSKKSEGKNKNDRYETPELIKIVINDLSKETENKISMSVGHILVFEENITESMITYPKDIFTFIKGESSTGASSITLTANFAASAQIFVEFDNNMYQLLLEIENEKKLPEREFNLDADVKKSQEVIASIINKPIGEALAIIKKAEVKHIIVSEDGLSFAVTMDYSPSRINLVLINDIVQDATLG
jgi:hypothetical protein